MGMTIDDVILCLKGIKQYGSDTFIKRSQGDWQNSLDVAMDTMRKYQMMQADYENRLKADLEAILVELQLEIEEIDSRAGYDGNGMPTFSTDYIRKKKVNKVIQQKIDALKAESEDNNAEVN